MNTGLHQRVTTTFDQIVAHTPDIGPAPSFAMRAEVAAGRSRSPVFLAAAAVVVLAAGGLVWINAARGSSDSDASVAAVTSTPLQPGGPTLLPVLDDSSIGVIAAGGRLDHVGVHIKPQTNAVLARVESDVTATDLYTFVAGEGAAAYADMTGVSTQAPSPEVVYLAGFGYAGWNVDGVPVVLMAADPHALLDDPGFSMTAGADWRGNATINFETLPADVEVLVAPRPLAHQAAMARLMLGRPAADGSTVPAGVEPPAGWAGSVTASLDNPLTNTNLTEGTTLRPTQVNGSDGWIVSMDGSDYRSLVFSPDGTTWVLVTWIGPEDELVTLAGELTFMPFGEAGNWVARYDDAVPTADI